VGVADVHLRSVFDQATRCKPNILLHYPGDLRPLRFSNFANEKRGAVSSTSNGFDVDSRRIDSDPMARL
jgi:hypothetical protein